MIIKNIYNKILLKCKKEKGRYNLVGANLWKADLSEADLRRACLSGANLREANLRRTNLMGANLCRADLTGANLSGAELIEANLWNADLTVADLTGANLWNADLSGANLCRADLSGADLTGAIGLIKEIDWLDANLEKTEEGYICYKSFGEHYNPPDNWVIEENSIIEDKNINQDRREDCAPGINVGTKEWCYGNCSKQVWKCLLKFEWLNEIRVPYGTDGNFRCGKLLILGKLE